MTTLRQTELLEVAKRNDKRLMHLIEDILEVTGIEGNTLKIKRERVNLCEIITNVIHDFVRSASKRTKIKKCNPV